MVKWAQGGGEARRKGGGRDGGTIGEGEEEVGEEKLKEMRWRTKSKITIWIRR